MPSFFLLVDLNKLLVLSISKIRLKQFGLHTKSLYICKLCHLLDKRAETQEEKSGFVRLRRRLPVLRCASPFAPPT